VGYEYDANSFVGARTYVGRFEHFIPEDDSQCAFCHLTDHTFRPRSNVGCGCHGNPEDPKNIRLDRDFDFNGNGLTNTERLEDEVRTFADRLLLALQDYSLKFGYDPVVYDPDRYPYFINGSTGGSYRFDDNQLKASFNYQMWAKDYGAWAHNTFYIMELLYDSIEDLQLAAEANGTPLDFNYLTTNPSTGASQILRIKKDGALDFLRNPVEVN